MVQEGVITIGTMSGIFTALLLNSLKNNIIDPIVEKTLPLDKIHDLLDDGKINNSVPKQAPKQAPNNNTGNFIFGNQFGGLGKDKINWKVFLRDFITWIIIIFILYLLWKYFLNPIKIKNNLSVPTTNTQYFPMGIGKNKSKL